MAVTYINFVKVDGLPHTNKAAQLPKVLNEDRISIILSKLSDTYK